MDLQLDARGKLPVYRQIVDQTHFAINTGALQPGQKLPSLRTLSKRHNIAINTVVKAFKALERRGLISAGPRSAYTVRKDALRPKPSAPKQKELGRYAARGVSATKGQVHAAIAGLDKGLFPGAFCKITDDFLTGDPDRCNVIHSDGSGTKSLLAYLKYRETGNASVFRGIAQDSVVMNLDDLLCVGATGKLVLSSTINRNPRRIGPDVLSALIEGTEQCLANLREHGVDIHSGGGETADVGDLTSTVVVDSCATAVMNKADVISGEGLRPGLAIVGLSSSGTASYENAENSGIGSNGLTSARHDLLASHYGERYPETYDHQTDKKLVYCGPHRLDDPLPGSSLSVGDALLSPTRSYAPVVSELLRRHRKRIKALVHCSGGGQTKCLNFGRGLHFVKDSLLSPPAIFKHIQRVSRTQWKEMYQVYNMGHRMEVYCAPRDVGAIVKVAESFGIQAQQVGHTERSTTGRNALTLHHQKRTLRYESRC